MTQELTLESELDRQLRAVRRGESETVVCPWCGTISNAESGDCCGEFSAAKDRLAGTHLKQIMARFRAVRNGLADSVQCPYCDGINRWENHESPARWKRPGVSVYCCDLMVFAVNAIGEHQRLQDQIDQARRIQDNIAKVSMN